MENIVERIRKLLARGRGGSGSTENETVFAMQQAHKLLAEHGLSLDDIKGKSSIQDFIIDNSLMTDSAQHWRRDLAANIARLYFCDYTFSFVRRPELQRKDRKYKRLDRHAFYGLPHNVAVCKEMFVYLVDTVERLAKEERRKLRESTSFETGFRKGCASRINAKLSDKWFESTREPATALLAGNKLPALYKQNDEQLAEFMTAVGKGITDAKDRSVSTSASGELAGWVAGKDVGLDTQIGEERPKGLIEQ